MAASSPATVLLRRLNAGDTHAADDLLPLVYDELHRLAEGYMQGERGGHTLQPTALVHEAFLRRVEGEGPEWEGRRHFLAVAARAMRRTKCSRAPD